MLTDAVPLLADYCVLWCSTYISNKLKLSLFIMAQPVLGFALIVMCTSLLLPVSSSSGSNAAHDARKHFKRSAEHSVDDIQDAPQPVATRLLKSAKTVPIVTDGVVHSPLEKTDRKEVKAAHQTRTNVAVRSSMLENNDVSRIISSLPKTAGVHASPEKTDDNILHPRLPALPSYIRDLNYDRGVNEWQDLDPCRKFCQCVNESADCSGYSLWKQYNHVPSFQRTILKLRVRNSSIKIETDDFFRNVRNIIELDISDNAISYVDRNAFSLLSQLKILHFSGNRLKFRSNIKGSSLQLIFAIPTLEELYLTGTSNIRLGQLGPIPRDFFNADFKTNLTILWLDHNNITELNLNTFTPFTRLRELNVNSSNIQTIVPAWLPSLEKLSAFNNRLGSLFTFCNDRLVPFFPKLLDIDLRRNKIKQYDHTQCSAKMTFLRLSFNEACDISPSYFQFVQPKVLFLDEALSKQCTIRRQAFYSETIVEIDLSLNGLDFASDAAVDAEAFLGSDHLSVLRLSGNTFRDIAEEKFHHMMNTLQSLNVLTLSDTKLVYISKRMLEGLKNITTIHFDNNMLRVIPDWTFNDLEHLTTLRLDSNLITTVSENTFSPGLRSRLKLLNLSNNPFECTCSLLWFRQWLQKEPVLFDYPNSPYKCSNIAGVDVATFVMNQQQCLLSHEAYVAIVVCFTLFILTLTLVTLLHRYRWHIRLLLYEAYRGERLARWRYRRQENFQYDLFVSYNSEDSGWVTDHLMPALEQQMGLRLCVHQRDFIPGKNIVDNILDCLQVSKRVLAVFSPQFAQSQWCHFELNLCLSHVVDNDDVMVVVMLQDVPARDVTGAMSAVMKTTTYIEWGDEAEAVASFWRRMTLALTDVLPALQE